MPDLKRANIESMGMIGDIDTIEVGKKEKDRTEQGILDLTGNVREWCRDLWAAYRSSTTPLMDPQGPPASAKGKGEYVVRGGSFATYGDEFRTTRPRRPRKATLTSRQMAEDGTSEDLGFRIVLEWPRPVPLLLGRQVTLPTRESLTPMNSPARTGSRARWAVPVALVVVAAGVVGFAMSRRGPSPAPALRPATTARLLASPRPARGRRGSGRSRSGSTDISPTRSPPAEGPPATPGPSADGSRGRRVGSRRAS